MHVNAAFETLAQIRLFYASLNTKNDSRFDSGNFWKEKAILLCESELWTSWLQHSTTLPDPLRAYLFTVVVFVQLSFMYKTALVSVAIL